MHLWKTSVFFHNHNTTIIIIILMQDTVKQYALYLPYFFLTFHLEKTPTVCLNLL